MTHVVFDRNKVLLGACAVAATLAFASASSAHGAGMGMGARGGAMAMQPPVAGPHPFDPSGHLGGPPINPSPPRVQPTPAAPRLDPPPANGGSSTTASGGVDTRSHAPFHYPNVGGGKLSGDTSGNADISPNAPKLDPPPK